MLIDVHHLPELEATDVEDWATRDARVGDVRMRFPVLAAGAVTRICERLAAARATYLAELPVQTIIDRIDAAAARLGDRADPVRRIADIALPAVTGYSAPMIEHILERSITDWQIGRAHV